jgi:archaemetzincin
MTDVPETSDAKTLDRAFTPWYVRHQLWLAAGSVVALVTFAAVFIVYPIAAAPDVGAPDDRDLPPAFSDDADFEPLADPAHGSWRDRFDEPIQDYERWLETRPAPPSEDRKIIYLQPVGEFGEDAPDLEVIAEAVRIYTGMEARIRPPLAFEDLGAKTRNNPMGGHEQWHSKGILDGLRAHKPDDAYTVLALTMTDLWPREGWNFVFGQASLKHNVGVQSFARYDPESKLSHRILGGTDLDREQVILRRSLKVVLHELGHTFGIRHCQHYKCIMNGSNSLRETDEAPLHMCPVDLRKMHHAVGFDLDERYRELGDFYERLGLDGDAAFVRRRAR